MTHFGTVVVCSGPKSSQLALTTWAQGCCRDRRNKLGGCSSSCALINWAFCTWASILACLERCRGAKLPYPWRRTLNVSLGAVLQDPLGIFRFYISRVTLHDKPEKKRNFHKYITYDPGNGSFAELLSCVFHSRCIVLFITLCQSDSSIILLFTVLPFSSAVKMKRKSMPLKRIMRNSPPARSVLLYFFLNSHLWMYLYKCSGRMQENSRKALLQKRNNLVGHWICKRLKTIPCPAFPSTALAFTKVCYVIRNVREEEQERSN